jgi:hypothetical protein
MRFGNEIRKIINIEPAAIYAAEADSHIDHKMIKGFAGIPVGPFSFPAVKIK